MRAIRDLVQAEGWSQREAARRLGLDQPEVCLVLKLRGRFGAGRYLDAWEHCGGRVEVKLWR